MSEPAGFRRCAQIPPPAGGEIRNPVIGTPNHLLFRRNLTVQTLKEHPFAGTAVSELGAEIELRLIAFQCD